MSFTHLDSRGNAIMVDVGEKPATTRKAIAKGRIKMSESCFLAVQNGASPKGDVIAAARIAGILAVKRTSDLIPLCHTLIITSAGIEFELLSESFEIEATCSVGTTGQTGAEMEALTGVSVALLTIYDMCKALDKAMVIGGVYLSRKTGGKSGDISNPHPVNGSDKK